MGAPAADAIVAERLKNGPYKSIFDFAERVDYSSVNRKAFETLALSGGFDSFGIRREQFFGKNNKGETFLDTLVRYGQLFQQEQHEAANSLFGGTEAIEIATPPIPDAESWSTIERLNRERELVGIYLSAHPLDEYSIILNSLCNTHCSELGDKQELAKKEDVVLGGIITGVKSKFTKTGKPCGFVTLEDFEGSGELALFGEDWGKWRGIMVEGSTIYITAFTRVTPGTFSTSTRSTPCESVRSESEQPAHAPVSSRETTPSSSTPTSSQSPPSAWRLGRTASSTVLSNSMSTAMEAP